MSDCWEVECVTDSLVSASFSVNFVRVPYDIGAEISVARELGLPGVGACALELLEGVYRGRADGWATRPGPALV